MSFRSVSVLVFGLLFGADFAVAQVSPTGIAPPGTLRIEAGGLFSSFNQTFGTLGGVGGSRTPFGTPFPAVLDSAVFVPLSVLERRIGRLDPPPPPPDGEEDASFHSLSDPLILHTVGLRLAADRREVPVVMELGVLPRVSIEVRVPLVQTWVEPTGLTFDGGNVGVNPDLAFNQRLVAGIDTTLIALAGSRLLPVAGTAAADRLQDTVRVLTGGGEFRLPASAVGDIGLTGLPEVTGLERVTHAPGVPDWRMGDLAVAARVELVNTIGLALAPVEGHGFRAIAEGGFRFATGSPVDAGHLGLPPPDDGLGGFFIAGLADAYLDPRIGISVMGRFDSFGSAEIARRTWIQEDEFPPSPVDQSLRWDAGRRIAVSAAPRVHLVEEIAIFGRYTLVHRSGERIEPEIGRIDSRSGHRWGVGAIYSTLRHEAPQVGRLPFEIALQLSGTAAGAGGQPARREVSAVLRFHPRLWGASPTASAGGSGVE